MSALFGTLAQHSNALVRAASLVRKNGQLGRHGESESPPPLIDRIIFGAQLPINPLGNTNAPIDVLIPCGPRDVRLLDFCIDGIEYSVANAISRMTVVSPDNIARNLRRSDVTWIRDAEVLPDGVEALIGTVEEGRRGWIRQQLIKLRMASSSQADATLVVDADTILLQKRSWFGDGRQVLIPTNEFHSPYHLLNARLLGDQHVAVGVSFVAHHQLMQRRILASFFGASDAQFFEASQRIVASLDSVDDPALSEFELYANLLIGSHPESTVLARWGNRTVPRETLLRLGTYQRILDRFSSAASVSAHWYLKNRSWGGN
jgi:hypothetical protein